MSLARVGLAVLAAICVPLLDAARTMAEPVTIKAGWINAPSSLIPIMFKKDGIAKHAGRSYRLEPVRFNASPPVLTALGSDDLDIGVLGFPILGFAIENAGMKDIRVIAGETPDGVDGYYSVQFFVRNDGPWADRRNERARKHRRHCDAGHASEARARISPGLQHH